MISVKLYYSVSLLKKARLARKHGNEIKLRKLYLVV